MAVCFEPAESRADTVGLLYPCAMKYELACRVISFLCYVVLCLGGNLYISKMQRFNCRRGGKRLFSQGVKHLIVSG
jgi:hypothetical protein